jgi:hypothetical protein
MRDERFKTVHRGGPLDLHRYRLLATWAADCVEHVLPLWSKQYPQDDRPRKAIETARAWSRGEVTVGQAREAAVAAHAAARDAAKGAAQAVARAAGHAVGTAHMADHARGAAQYAIKAVQAANKTEDRKTADRERVWQQERLPEEIRSLMLPNA